MAVNNLIQVRRGTATEWSTSNPVLAVGEPGFDTTNDILKIGDGSTAWNSLAAANNSDHPNISAAGSVNNAGNQFVQDITVDSNGHITSMTSTTVTQLTQEEVEDFVGAMVSGNTETGITVTYQDADGTLDFVVDHDAASNFVANEHIDHTAVTLTAGDGLTGGGDISANRTFAVNVDDSTIEINSDTLRIKDAAITSAKIGAGGFVFNEAGAAVDFRVEGDTDANLLFVDGSADSIGIGIASPAHKLDVVYPDSGCVRFADPAGSGIMIGDCALSSNATYAGMQHTKMVGSYMMVSNGDDTYISARDTQSVFIRGGGNDANSEISIHDVGIGGVGIVFNEQGADRDIRMEGASDVNVFRLDASADSIGIGTATPGYKLDVSGEARIMPRSSPSGSTVYIGRHPSQATIEAEGSTQQSQWMIIDSAGSGMRTALNYFTDDDVALAYGGGSVTVGTITAGSYKFRVHGGSSAFDGGNVIINQNGDNYDFRVEGDTEEYLLFTDASTDRVGIGTSTPDYKFTVVDGSTKNGTAGGVWYAEHTGNGDAGYALARSGSNKWSIQNDYSDSDALNIRQGGFGGTSVIHVNGTATTVTINASTNQAIIGDSATVFNEGGANIDFRVEGDTQANLLFCDASTDTVGIGTSAPALQSAGGGLHIADTTSSELKFTNDTTAHTATDGTALVSNGSDFTINNRENGYVNIGQNNTTRCSFSASSVIFNSPGNDYDFIVEGDTDTDLLFVDAGNDIVQIGKLNINGAFTLPTADGSANQILKTDGNGTVSWAADGGGGGGGSMTTVKANGSQVGGADIVTLDFASNFAVTETPDTEVNIDLSSSISTQGITATTGLIVGVSGLHHQSGTIVHSTEAAWGDFAGNAQNSLNLLTGKTTDANFTSLEMNNGMYSGVKLPSNKTFFANASIVGRRTNVGIAEANRQHAAYELKACITNDAFGRAIVGSATKTVIAESNSAWDVQFSFAGGGSGQTDFLLVQCKGAASTNINWVAKVDLLEVGGLNETSAYQEANILTHMSPEIIP